ncbi:hypothetical protein GCM10010095_55390 [Streptomyces anthocyanicus]|uniref:Uncharacterized protein n=1 Tax=Streptomyces violaceolatus TaxID=67378 RepID=A0ABN3SI42_9ACTN|nr:hypothetical protein GCM10010095_55390 [Streptomyces anthocyanicus]GHA65501.1 hypothetical protein GCM10010391_59010 [Streptomyces anthocyanicus]
MASNIPAAAEPNLPVAFFRVAMSTPESGDRPPVVECGSADGDRRAMDGAAASRVPSGADRRGGGEEAHGGKRGSHGPAPWKTSAPRTLLTIVHFVPTAAARILSRQFRTHG